MAALRRHSICRALRQSLSLISSSFQPRYVNTDLCQQGRGCSASNVVSVEGKCNRDCVLPVFWNGGFRSMSSQGRGIRSRVEKRMRKETGRTLREIRRAKKLRKKLMTEDERLIFSLRRAKKKVALLLQKLKKYELPELPPSRHDPELFTPEQLQAIKKVGFKNRNYVPIGVRGVFGGVVQNMHLHWKFHETVQVCCDTLPKEKIKETAIMLARLSGGVVVNIHDVKTIIMFRGRNYRQPKILIPINTLTKRKALFKARFEQALESQKINIRKIEQQLRRLGVNPEDPIAMASVQKVASTFFRAIDEKQGTPYVFHGNKEPLSDTDMQETQCPSEDSDQEELDRFIAEIEKAADDEWAAEEAAEKEETGKIRYWNKPAIDDNWNSEDMSGRIRRGAMDVRRVVDREEDVDDEGRRGQRDMDDKGRRGQGGIFEKNRRAQRDMFDRTRRSKDMEDDWNSDGSVLDKDRRNMRNIDSDWDTEDEADEEGRGHKSDTDDPLESESESESEIVYDNNRCQGTGRIDQRNMADRTRKGQIYTSDRSIKGRHIDDDWDSEDEEVDRDRTMMGSINDDGDTEEEVADKSGECKSDMYDYWSSEEEVDDNVRRGEMVMRDDSDCEEVVGRGRRQEIDGDKDWDDASKTVDSNRRKKHIDESWDSD